MHGRFAFVLLCACEASRPASASPPIAPPIVVAPAPVTKPSVGRVVEHEGREWSVFELDLAKVKLELLGQGPDEPRTFDALTKYLGERRLVMATNGGIFTEERSPLGLHIQEGRELHALSNRDGGGNFYLKPNGVFWIDAEGPHVAATERYAPHGDVVLATQSGPILVERGEPHPKFTTPGTSRKLRSAVGVDAQGHVWIAISHGPVSFIDSATLFRDRLGCPDALYLDGEISGLLSPTGIEGWHHHEYGSLLVATER